MLRTVAIAVATALLFMAVASAQPGGDLRATLQARYDALKTAMHAHDDRGMQAVLAPRFQSVDVRGQVGMTSEMIAEVDALPADPNRTSGTTIDSVVANNGIATVEQHYSMHTTRADAGDRSQTIELSARSTDTWVLRQGVWLLQQSVTHEMTMSRDGRVVQHLSHP